MLIGQCKAKSIVNHQITDYASALPRTEPRHSGPDNITSWGGKKGLSILASVP